jgi:hypothetical protein
MKQTDYSDRAVTIRIRQVSQLRKLCLSLARAKSGEQRPTVAGDRSDSPR